VHHCPRGLLPRGEGILLQHSSIPQGDHGVWIVAWFVTVEAFLAARMIVSGASAAQSFNMRKSTFGRDLRGLARERGGCGIAHTKLDAAHHSGCGAACRSGTPLYSENCLPAVASSPTGHSWSPWRAKLELFVVTPRYHVESRVSNVSRSGAPCVGGCLVGRIPFSWRRLWNLYSALCPSGMNTRG
jgi:hypothetical protein